MEINSPSIIQGFLPKYSYPHIDPQYDNFVPVGHGSNNHVWLRLRSFPLKRPGLRRKDWVFLANAFSPLSEKKEHLLVPFPDKQAMLRNQSSQQHFVQEKHLADEALTICSLCVTTEK